MKPDYRSPGAIYSWNTAETLTETGGVLPMSNSVEQEFRKEYQKAQGKGETVKKVHTAESWDDRGQPNM